MGKIEDIDMIRIRRGTKKVCRCYGASFIVDPECKAVYCAECGAEVNAIDAIIRIARNREQFNRIVEAMQREIEEVSAKRRRTRLFRDLEKQYLSKPKMVPVCPECGQPFQFESLNRFVYKEFLREEQRPHE